MNSFIAKLTSPKVALLGLLLAILLPFQAMSNTDIIGTIWIDEDLNITYNGESGINGVVVNLIDAESMTVIESTVSSGGNYTFLNLTPGKYIITIPSSQFLTGALLNSFVSCTGTNPADDSVDNDDNGSDTNPSDISTTIFSLTDEDPNNNVTIEYIDFCFQVNDCSDPNPLASTSCDQISDSDIICDINTIGAFCAVMPSNTSGGNQPDPLCTGASDPADNISWFAFVAYGGNYSIRINPTGCSSGSAGLSGIQVGLYSDCSFSESVFCSGGCNISPIEISSSVLVEGQTYYMFIDGCGGDVCSYSIDITGTPILPDITPQNVCVNNNGIIECDSTDYCIGGDVFLEVSDNDLNADYTWSITTISGNPYLGNTFPQTTENKLQISFSSQGEYLVCIENINNGCQNWTGSVCTTIKTKNSISFPGDETFANQFVCIGDEDNYDINILDDFDPNGDGTPGWQGPTADIAVGNNSATILIPGCSYSQEFDLGVYEEQPVSNVFLSICGNDLPMQIEDFTLDQSSFEDSDIITIDSVLSLTPNANGCDNIINYTIEKLDIIDGFMNPPVCTFNSVILNFDYNSQESTGLIYLNFTWRDPFGNILFDPQGNNDPSDMEVPSDNPSGTYTLTVTITKSGVQCEYVYPVEVDFEDIQPPTPTVSGLTMVCSGSNSEATYTAMGGGASFNYIWTVPSDAVIVGTSGPLGSMLTVDWSNSDGGEITLQSENECGFSEITSLSITVIPTTLPDFSIDAEACVGGESTVMSTGNGGNIVSYLWNFGGAQVISGGSFNLGPNVISWNTSGTKTVSLQTTNTSGCVSEPITKTIEVIEPLTPTTMICQPTINDILFIWEEQPGVTYEVEIFTGQTGVFEGNNSYRVSGLSGGDIVTLELLQTQTSGICTDPASTLLTCEAQDCPFIAISLSSSQTTFCENELGETLISAIVTSQVNGSGAFAGPGISNPNGLFDPKQAEIGINTITYTYIDENGCSAIETIDMTVIAAPVADISSDDLQVCKGGSMTLNYSGTQGIDTYNWQSEGLMIENIQNPTITFPTVGIKTIRLSVTKDGCVSEEATIDIEVVDSPEATFTLSADTICLSQEVQLQYTGIVDVDDYDWSAGVGNVDNLPNPLVSFIFPGEKVIELIVSSGDCVSEVFTQTLLVEPPLDPVNITCTEGDGMIQFDWNDVDGASSYLIGVNGNVPFVTTNTNLDVNNLTSGEEVEIIVEAVSDGQCPNVLSTISCVSLISAVSDDELLAVNLYPNPATQVIYIEHARSNDRFSIFDVNGRLLRNGNYNDSIDIRNLNKGLYFIKVSDEEGKRNKILKFVKQ